jgi:hypothetical protein
MRKGTHTASQFEQHLKNAYTFKATAPTLDDNFKIKFRKAFFNVCGLQ